MDGLDRLPSRQREVLERLLAGQSRAEIAQELEMTNATVRSTLRHARERLKAADPKPRPGYRSSPRFGPFMEALLEALELGNWRGVLIAQRFVQDEMLSPGERNFEFAVGLVAKSMFFQAVGNVTQAWTTLQSAAARLPPRLVRRDPEDHDVLIDTPRSAPGQGTEQDLTWRLCSVAWREQSELLALRRRFRDPNSRRDELIEACIEHLTWVECDPWTWQAPTQETAALEARLQLPPNFGLPGRRDLIHRASDLRQFANPRAGMVSESVWKDIGGYRRLKALAVRRMAQRPVEPWLRFDARDTDPQVPVRAGRAVAWDQATASVQLTRYQ